MFETKINTMLKEAFDEYSNVLKPLSAELMTKYQAIPTSLNNELVSALDHTARIFSRDLDAKAISIEIEKIRSHLRRAIFDCIKFLIVDYEETFRKIDKSSLITDISNVDNGNFINKYLELRDKARDHVRKSKIIVSENYKESFEHLLKAYELYSKLDNLISENRNKIKFNVAKNRTKSILKFLSFILIAFLAGILTNILLPHLINLINQIFNK